MDPLPKVGDWKDIPQCGIVVNFNSGHINHHIIESVHGYSDAEMKDHTNNIVSLKYIFHWHLIPIINTS